MDLALVNFCTKVNDILSLFIVAEGSHVTTSTTSCSAAPTWKAKDCPRLYPPKWFKRFMQYAILGGSVMP